MTHLNPPPTPPSQLALLTSCPWARNRLVEMNHVFWERASTARMDGAGRKAPATLSVVPLRQGGAGRAG